MLGLKAVLQGRSVKNFTSLASGTVAAQILMVLSSPIITRLYNEEEFGLYAVYASVVAILAVVASMRYELVIPLVPSQAELNAILKLCLILCCVVALAFLTVFVLFSEQIIALFSLPINNSLLLLSVLGIFVTGLLTILNFLCVSKQEFKVVARSKLVHSVAHITIQIMASSFGAFALALGQVSGKVFAMLSMLPKALSLWRKPVESAEPSLFVVAKNYRRFPIFSTWAALFNVIGENLPFLLLAVLFSPAVAGAFALTHRVLSLPITVISSLVGDIFYSQIKQNLEDGTLPAKFDNTYSILSLLITMPCLLFVVIGPDLFAFIFGESWRLSGEYARFMAFQIYSNFVASPLATIMSALEKENEFFVFNIVLILLRVGVIFYGASQGDALLTIALFCFVSSACYFALLIRAVVLSKIGITKLFFNTGLPLAFNLVFVLPLIFVSNGSSFTPAWWVALLGGLLAALFYFLISINKKFRISEII
ncbi:MAG: lipopolysaccharide biosynthesis protein [Gammaproteobacteria bacterium]